MDPGQQLVVIDQQLVQQPRTPEQLVERFLARYENANSKTAMRASLRALVRLTAFSGDVEAFPWASLTYAQTSALRAALVAAYSPASANRHLAALKGILTEARRLDLLSAEQASAALDVPSAKLDPGQRAGRMLTDGEVEALLSLSQRPGPRDVRDGAAFALALGGGLRREEAVIAQREKLDVETGRLEITGKGNKTRVVYFGPQSFAAIKSWLALRGDAPGCILWACDARGQIRTGSSLTPAGYYAILLRRVEELGIEHLTPHDLRRTLISTLWDRDVDGSAIQQMVGHANIRTTAGYDRRGERAVQKAAARGF